MINRNMRDKYMRKKAILVLTFALCMAGLSACGKENKTENTSAVTEEQQTDFAVQELADKIKSEITFTDLSVIENGVAINRLYELDENKIDSAAFYSNSNATAEDIAVIKVNDESYVADVKKAFETRVADQKESFQSYNANEVPKLDDAVIISGGKYVVLVVSGDSAKAKEIIGQYIK